MTAEPYDVLAMGRSSIDLYSNDVGSPFVDIKSFAAYVGGCPTNISVGTRRLGLRSALLTAVGADVVGDFVLKFLDTEGVETAFIPRKPGRRTSAVVLGIEPPDKFPLVFYRDNCADIALDIDDVLAAPVETSRALLISGTGLSADPSRSATLFAAERARAAGAEVVLDIDFRADQWSDPRAFGVTIRSVLPHVDLVIGTQDEINAAMLTDPAQVSLTHSQVSDARVGGDVAASVHAFCWKSAAHRAPECTWASTLGPPQRSTCPGSRWTSPTSSARATHSRRASCSGTCAAGTGIAPPAWATPAAPSS
jgi:5-dehydro-2-deoxygluconokinase